MDTELLKEWSLGIAVLLFTAVLVQFLKAILRRFHKVRWLQELGPSFANFLYVIGVQIFLDLAPLHPKAALWLDSADYVLGVIIFLAIVRRALLLGVSWTSQHAHEGDVLIQGFIPLLRNILTLFVVFAGAIMILKRFNYDVLSLLTALGVGSLAVGLAAKDTLSNMISGFTLIIDRNFKPGDRINLGGMIGDVEEIGLRSTRIHMPEGNTVIVPNSELVNSKILNLSLPSREQEVKSDLRVPYTVKFETVQKLIEAILKDMAANHKIHPHRSRSVALKSLQSGGQQIGISFWVEDMSTASGALSELLSRVLQDMRDAGIPLQSGLPVTEVPPV